MHEQYMVRLALMLEMLPWGSADRGVTSGQIARGLARDGIGVDANTVLRDLKAWQPCWQLICNRGESNQWLWKRPSRHVSLLACLQVDEYRGQPLERVLDDEAGNGLDEYSLPDWHSDIEFWR